MVDETDTTHNVELGDKIEDLFSQLEKVDKRKKLEVNMIKNKLNDYITIYNRQVKDTVYKKVKL